MTILNKAARVCRAASHTLRAFPSALSRLTVDNTLEAVASVLCVQRGGVMVCGPAGVSVAHFPGPQFSTPEHTH